MNKKVSFFKKTKNFFQSDNSIILVHLPLVLCTIYTFVSAYVSFTENKVWSIFAPSLLIAVLLLGIFFAEYKRLWPGASSVVLLSIPTFMFIIQSNSFQENETMISAALITVVCTAGLSVVSAIFFFFFRKKYPKLFLGFIQFVLIISNIAICLYCSVLICAMDININERPVLDRFDIKPSNYALFATAILSMFLAILLGTLAANRGKEKVNK